MGVTAAAAAVGEVGAGRGEREGKKPNRAKENQTPQEGAVPPLLHHWSLYC